jgi:hypothetical protein
MNGFELIELLNEMDDEDLEKVVVDDCQYEITHVHCNWNGQFMLGTRACDEIPHASD